MKTGTHLCYAGEGATEVGELGAPCGADEGAELVDDVELAGLALGCLVFPSEEADGPFLSRGGGIGLSTERQDSAPRCVGVKGGLRDSR